MGGVEPLEKYRLELLSREIFRKRRHDMAETALGGGDVHVRLVC